MFSPSSWGPEVCWHFLQSSREENPSLPFPFLAAAAIQGTVTTILHCQPLASCCLLLCVCRVVALCLCKLPCALLSLVMVFRVYPVNPGQFHYKVLHVIPRDTFSKEVNIYSLPGLGLCVCSCVCVDGRKGVCHCFHSVIHS